MKNFLIFFADERQTYLSSALREAGNVCKMFSSLENIKSQIKEADFVILPLPSIKNGFINGSDIPYEQFCEQLDNNSVVFASCVENTEFASLVRAKGSKLYDYYARNELIVSNAYATAQGVLQLLLNETNSMANKQKVLVSGYGKTGKAICRILDKVGFNVTVAVRRQEYISELSQQNIKGVFYEEIKEDENDFDFLINTVPQTVIDSEILQTLPKKCSLIEVASKPYGIDMKEAEKIGFFVKIAASLPGKSVPKSAGEFVAETVDNIIKEEKLWIK